MRANLGSTEAHAIRVARRAHGKRPKRGRREARAAHDGGLVRSLVRPAPFSVSGPWQSSGILLAPPAGIELATFGFGTRRNHQRLRGL